MIHSLSFRRSRLVFSVSLLATIFVLSACGDKSASADAGAGGAAPPPEVAVVIANAQTLPLVTELSGRLEASRIAEVRARAAGIVQKRLFKEGSDVRAGQALFAIDSAPYKAALASAQASLNQARATLVNATGVVNRYRPLVAAKAVSQQEFDNAVAAQKAAKAQVDAGLAQVDAAKINLSYANVTAPISGRIGRALVTEGALVGQSGSATQLATISQVDPLYVNISQSASAVMRLRAQLSSGAVQSESDARVDVVLEDGSVYKHQGKLLFSDLTVDPATGQVLLRAEIPNPDGDLFPGLFVRAKLEQAQIDNAMLIPQQAVTRGGAAGDTVIVVNDDGSFVPKVVNVAGASGQDLIISGGLNSGDKVMVEGAMKLMMGAKVLKPVLWKGDASNALSNAPAASQAPALDAENAAQ